MRAVLSVTAVLEAATGLGILALPSVVSSLILGALPDTVAALVFARVAGVALLALGVTCWLARHDEGARAVRGLVGGMALYNVGVLALLAHAALVWGASGIALWPLVVGHAVMAFWCIVSLKARHPEGNAASPSKELKRTSVERIGRSQPIASLGRTEAAVDRRMAEWSDDPAFWQAMEPALCAGSRLAVADADAAAIVTCTGLSSAASVLDLACGPGAHAIALARRGHRVTGVDASHRLLERARATAQREGVQVEWVEADMREFRRVAGFDLVCSLYASFGYFDDEQDRQVLENVRASVAPGGALVLDLVGREAAARHWQERRWQEVDGVLYLEQCAPVEDWSYMLSDWTVVADGKRLDFRVKQRLYSGTELRDMLLSVGFASVRLAGDLSGGTAYDESARRLVAVARMPTRC